MCIKGGISRLAQPEKTEFTHVNEYFEGKRNAEITVLDTSLPQHTLVCANFASKQDTKRAELDDLALCSYLARAIFGDCRREQNRSILSYVRILRASKIRKEPC